jgi:hypothetical protein
MKYKFLTMITAALVVSTCLSPVSASSSKGTFAVVQANAHAAYSIDTDLGTLLDDPLAKAILQKYIPELLASDQLDLARNMSLKQIQQYAPDKVGEDTLKKIDEELARLNVQKS